MFISLLAGVLLPVSQNYEHISHKPSVIKKICVYIFFRFVIISARNYMSHVTNIYPSVFCHKSIVQPLQ